jgi:hypothetical protein
MEASFKGFSIKNIPRGENEHADLLAKSVTHGLPLPSKVFFETIKAPSVELMERAVLTISPMHSEDWRTEIVSFLQGNCLLNDESYIKRMEARTRPYVIIEEELYKQGVCSPLLKCLSRTEGQELMNEIHTGLCGAHIGSKPLLGKVLRQGFYWPKTASDAADLVQKCESCQKCARDKKQHSSLTQLIQLTWPLQKWGLDLLGPLPLVRHPQSNGLVERANGIIIIGIMKSIFNHPKGKWPDKLIKVVWNHNTIVSRSTGFTPFKLLFGDEAITPEEARTGFIRTLA